MDKKITNVLKDKFEKRVKDQIEQELKEVLDIIYKNYFLNNLKINLSVKNPEQTTYLSVIIKQLFNKITEEDFTTNKEVFERTNINELTKQRTEDLAIKESNNIFEQLNTLIKYLNNKEEVSDSNDNSNDSCNNYIPF